MSATAGRIALHAIFVLFAAFAAIIYSGQVEWFLQKVTETIHNKKGCNPLPFIGNISLHYFDVRGRAESIRMLMHDNGMAHVETRFTKEIWKQTKEAGLDAVYTFGQLPYIQTNRGVELVQSHAILHYLGRSVGLDCDCKDLHHCEIVSLGVEDFRQRISRLMYSPDFSYKTRDEYVKGQLRLWLQHFENLIIRMKQRQDDSYFGGDRVTWVDYLVFDLLEAHDEFINATRSKTSEKDIFFLDSFPTLKQFYTSFAKRPMLAQYLKADERIAFKLPKPIKVPKSVK